jgi:hypothetical protein
VTSESLDKTGATWTSTTGREEFVVGIEGNTGPCRSGASD